MSGIALLGLALMSGSKDVFAVAVFLNLSPLVAGASYVEG